MDKYYEVLTELERFKKKVKKLENREGSNYLYIPERAAVKRGAIDLKKTLTEFVRSVYEN